MKSICTVCIMKTMYISVLRIHIICVDDTEYSSYSLVFILFVSVQMCVNQRCMPVADQKLALCNCYGNGVCNNNGHCHCDVGYAPPDCLHPGLGGSEDSGPASNPHGRS